MKKIISKNPAKNYSVIDEVVASSKKEIKRKVDMANKAKEAWRDLGLVKRINLIEKAYKEFKANADEIAKLITKEVGTPITECKDEVDWDWSYWEWFLQNVEKAISPETVYKDNNTSHQIWYEPVGSVAVITPWNLPFDLFLWGVIPNLLVGNTVVYKTAEECILSGKLFEKIMSRVGLPKGVFNVIHGDGEEGKYLTEQNIDMIWFTGSSGVGKQIYSLAGKKFIRSVLEMGGSNPAIILSDAKIDDFLLNSILFKRFSFGGQTCDADKRLIIHKSKYEEFIGKFKQKVESLKVGLPEKPKTQFGPLVSKKQLDLLASQVNDAIKKGAKVLTGGKQPKNLKGAYFLPTLLTNINKNMRVWKEEVFGPVLPIITFTTNEEAIELANDSIYGLGSQIFSQDNNKILKLASKLKTGNVDVNGCGHFKPYNPFGGYKLSGMGREHGIHGFRELCQIKTVSIKK